MEAHTPSELETENRLLKTMVNNFRNLCARQKALIDDLTAAGAVDRWMTTMMAATIHRETSGMQLVCRIDDLTPEVRPAMLRQAAADGVPHATRVLLITCAGGAVIRFQP